MKKHISLILVMTLLLTVLFSLGSVALAATELSVKPQITSAATGGDFVFDYYVSNDTDTTIQGPIVCTTTGKQVVDLVVVAPHSTAPTEAASFKMNVPDNLLGTDLAFSFNGDALKTTARIDKKTLSTKIAGTPAVPRTLYGEGESVKFEFKIENQGETTLENIVISAPELNGGKGLNDGFSLAPGQSATKKFSYTMAKDITINPVVNYSVAGAAQSPYAMSPVALTLEKRDVKPELSADNMKPTPGQEVTFTLKLTNGGNVPYSDIKVLANGESKDFPTKLDANGTQTGTFKMTFQTSTEVFCSISLKDHTGETKQINSNTVKIDLPVDSTAVDSKLGFTMSVDRPQLTSAGSINFTGMITNGTDYELKNIKVTEATLGDIYTADTLAAGSTANIEYPVDINATTTYNFVLTATDKDGNAYTKNAEPVAVTIQSADATATPGYDDAADVTESLAPDGNLGAGSIGTLGIIAIILVVLIIGVGIALFVLWKKGQGPKGPTTPGRKRPVTSSSSSVRKRPVPQKSYRDRNNF